MFNHSLTHLRTKREKPAQNFLREQMHAIAQDRLADIQRRFEHAAPLGALADFQESTRDAVVLVGALDTDNHVPETLARARDTLMPDGLFLAVFLGGETLYELRDALQTAELELSGGAAARVHPMIDVRDAAALLLRAGFALPVADRVTLRASYANLQALMHELRALGMTNILEKRSRQPLTRAVLARAQQHYQTHYSDEEHRLIATFDIVVMTGWKPAATQQKPAARGSGKISLVTALGDRQT